MDYFRFLPVTASLAFKIIPETLSAQLVFLCIDDTMAGKYGDNFEHISNLFDHAAHNSSNYLNGHCFVSLMLCVPVWHNGKVHYQSVPLGYHMWKKEASKLLLAAEMVNQVMPALSDKKNVILLCDSWYAKTDLLRLVDCYGNLDVICNARCDSEDLLHNHSIGFHVLPYIYSIFCTKKEQQYQSCSFLVIYYISNLILQFPAYKAFNASSK